MNDLKGSEPEIEVLTPARIGEEEGLVKEIKSLAGLVVVQNKMDLDAAVLFLHTVDEQEKKIGALLDPHIKRAYEAHRGLTAEKKKLLTPLEEAKAITKRAMNAYVAQEEARRREEEMKARKLAQKEEEDRKIRIAELAEQQGMAKLADQIISQPVEVPLAAVALPTVKSEMDGMTVVDVWKFEVTDFATLVAAVADPQSNIPLTVLEYKASAIQMFAGKLQEKMNWPGVRVWKEREVRRTGRR